MLLGWRSLSKAQAADWRLNGRNSECPPVVARRIGLRDECHQRVVPFELGGEVDLAFAPDGVICRMELPGGVGR